MNKIIGSHTSPGVYTQITDLSYSASSIGSTTLGLVGETLKGPAFEPIPIKNWAQYKDYFGGTSAEKFQSSQYPKYELPYIAKSYLSASDQLYVCRVLGLSGYNAGPAFILTAEKSGKTGTKKIIAVLRSRGEYGKGGSNVDCNSTESTDYDSLAFYCDSIELDNYTSPNITYNECSGSGTTNANSGTTSTGVTNISIDANNHGRFNIKCLTFEGGDEPKAVYPVSLNPTDKDYILNVLGTNPTEGSADVYVEALYDYFLEDLISQGYNQISNSVISTGEVITQEICDPVVGFATIPQSSLVKSNVGQTYVIENADDVTELGLKDNEFDAGDIIIVAKNTTATGTTYSYKHATDSAGKVLSLGFPSKPRYIDSSIDQNETTEYNYLWSEIQITSVSSILKMVKVLSNNAYYCLNTAGTEVIPLTTANDMGDYKESFRSAVTPWVVSELKGDMNNIDLKKLFRFYTITDGNAANTQIKISIANIRPDDGTFDVYVRDFYDTDSSPVILESYKALTMVPGTERYIGNKIGTVDGSYESKSKYIIAEIIENDMTAMCIPGGFVGYPVQDVEGAGSPTFKYNTAYNSTIKDKRQYFGLSDITGVDVDMLTYKGKHAYTTGLSVGHTKGFHLDCTLTVASGATIKVDGEDSCGWDTVNKNNVTSEGKSPILSTEKDMIGTIYENVNLRKFTMYPYGGFDGWDIYRTERTNGDEYNALQYKGNTRSGSKNSTFTTVSDERLPLTGNTITSDYYAYLAGALMFRNTELFPINLFATPGIDYVNQKLLSTEILNMIEEERGDSLYVMTTPDKPKGASDAVDEMYTSSEAVDNLSDSGIDTYYAATYYPWVKCYDATDNKYINLPATKDVLRNMANIDNKKYPWFAPAGIERGNVDCVKMHFFAKLEDEDTVYENRINPLKTFSKDGVKIWGNKTMYKGDTPMNRINTVRLVLYLRRLISESVRTLIFEPNDTTLKAEFESIVRPILSKVKSERGITDFRLDVSQTVEEMDAHELSCRLWIKPTPTLEYIAIEFMVTPQGVSFSD